MPSGSLRCRAHPSRPAHGRCPTCGRPRCRSDARSHPNACAVCAEAPSGDLRRSRPLERLVRGALGAALAVPLVGAVGTQYVDAGGPRLLVPALAGVGVAEAVLRAAGGTATPRALLRPLRLLAVAAAVLAVAAAFSFRPGEGSLVEPAGRVLPAYAAAALSAAFWTRPRGAPERAPAVSGG